MSSIKSGKFAIAFLCMMLLAVGAAITQSTAIAQSPEGAMAPQAGSAPNTGSSAEAPPRPVQGRSLFGIIIAGGPLMIPIGICSFILVLFTLERLVSLRKSQIVPALCDKSNSTVSRIFRAGVQKWGRSAVEVEQAILDAGERAAWDLRRFLRGINGIATVSPLLGLFGTVVGMIQSFDSIAVVDSTMADQKALIATGISVALITTAAGLTVAIPALVSHLLITGIVDRRIMELDSLGMKVVNLVSAEALGLEAARSKSKSKAA
jgi:biopolymer transport protein ExbB